MKTKFASCSPKDKDYINNRGTVYNRLNLFNREEFALKTRKEVSD
ncbi:MAG: hypothetical protein P4L27_12335 [Ignavibacteriaceae bacterium]|nr:hypothetical protein [Ignavibacteriaceae bacterium]